MEWKTQMPWISYDNEKGIARCTICTKAKFSHDSESEFDRAVSVALNKSTTPVPGKPILQIWKHG